MGKKNKAKKAPEPEETKDDQVVHGEHELTPMPGHEVEIEAEDLYQESGE